MRLKCHTYRTFAPRLCPRHSSFARIAKEDATESTEDPPGRTIRVRCFDRGKTDCLSSGMRTCYGLGGLVLRGIHCPMRLVNRSLIEEHPIACKVLNLQHLQCQFSVGGIILDQQDMDRFSSEALEGRSKRWDGDRKPGSQLRGFKEDGKIYRPGRIPSHSCNAE